MEDNFQRSLQMGFFGLGESKPEIIHNGFRKASIVCQQNIKEQSHTDNDNEDTESSEVDGITSNVP